MLIYLVIYAILYTVFMFSFIYLCHKNLYTVANFTHRCKFMEIRRNIIITQVSDLNYNLQ